MCAHAHNRSGPANGATAVEPTNPRCAHVWMLAEWQWQHLPIAVNGTHGSGLVWLPNNSVNGSDQLWPAGNGAYGSAQLWPADNGTNRSGLQWYTFCKKTEEKKLYSSRYKPVAWKLYSS